MVTRFAVPLLFGPLASSGAAPLLVLLSPPPLPAESWAAISPVLPLIVLQVDCALLVHATGLPPWPGGNWLRHLGANKPKPMETWCISHLVPATRSRLFWSNDQVKRSSLYNTTIGGDMSSHTALPIEPLDVLIIGAGVSGIGAAAYLRRHQPHKVFAIRVPGANGRHLGPVPLSRHTPDSTCTPSASTSSLGPRRNLWRMPPTFSNTCEKPSLNTSWTPSSSTGRKWSRRIGRATKGCGQYASRTATRQKPAPSNAAGCSAQAATTVMTKASAHASRARSSSRGKSSTRNTGPSAWTIGASMWWSSAAAQRR